MKKTDKKQSKFPFWPSKYQMLSMAASALGAIIGPSLVYLGFLLLEKFYPENTGGALVGVLMLVLSIPFGATAGAFLVMAITKRNSKHR